MTKLIFGCGYLGKCVAQLWMQRGEMVMGVTRSDVHGLELAKAGLFTIGADVTKPETLECLKSLSAYVPLDHTNRAIDTVLFAVGFDRSAGGSIEEVYAGGVKNVLAALPSDVSRFIYISTTGVYGDACGGWVDEDTPPDPQREGGRASLAAEHALEESPFASRGIVLRLAGIYGPGRIPFLDKLRAGEPIPAVSAGYLNLIHVDDAAQAVVAAGELSRRSAMSSRPNVKRMGYCVSDGHPVERGEYYREVARCIGAAPPAFVTPELNSPQAARAEANRRVRNSRMLAELGVKLAYPDYRTGLAAILGGCESTD